MVLAGSVAALSAVAALAAPAGAASGNGVSVLSPKRIVAVGARNTEAATSYVVTGHFNLAGKKVVFRVADAGDGDGSGTIAFGSIGATFRKVGTTVYVLGSTSFWRTTGGAAAVKAYAGRWVEGPVSNSVLKSAAQFLDGHSLFHSFSLGTVPSGLTKAGRTVIAGQPAIVIAGTVTESGGSSRLRYAVATTGRAYLLSVAGGATVGTASIGVTMTFSHLNQQVHVAAPAKTVPITKVPLTTTTTTTISTPTTTTTGS
jgi:hypothetical protein